MMKPRLENAEIGIGLIKEVLERFVDEHLDTLLYFRCELGRLLSRAGRCEESEDLLQAVVSEHPLRACGYAALSDELAGYHREHPDFGRAIALLEQALAIPVPV